MEPSWTLSEPNGVRMSTSLFLSELLSPELLWPLLSRVEIEQPVMARPSAISSEKQQTRNTPLIALFIILSPPYLDIDSGTYVPLASPNTCSISHSMWHPDFSPFHQKSAWASNVRYQTTISKLSHIAILPRKPCTALPSTMPVLNGSNAAVIRPYQSNTACFPKTHSKGPSATKIWPILLISTQ